MSRNKKARRAPAAARQAGISVEAFNAMAARLEAMEQDMAELRAALAQQVVQSHAQELAMTPEDVAEAEARAAAEDARQAEADFGYVISTNVTADVARLLGDRILAVVDQPRPGAPARYEEVRLQAASDVVGRIADRYTTMWSESEPLVDQPWSKMPPFMARHTLLRQMRQLTAQEMANKQQDFIDERVSDIFVHERPTLSFNRVEDAPKAVEEGHALAEKVVFQVFDELCSEMPGGDRPEALAQSDEAIRQTKGTVMRVLGKYRRFVNKSEQPKTHEELMARCYMGVLTNTMDAMFALAGAGDKPLGEGAMPLRMAGSILSVLQIAQRPNPDNEPEEVLEEQGLKNGEPVTTVKALQTRELLRVVDAVWDSIYDGELQFHVQGAYVARAMQAFPGEAPRDLTERFKAVGWDNVARSIKAMHGELFREVHKQDGWTNPDRVPLERDQWTMLSARLH